MSSWLTPQYVVQLNAKSPVVIGVIVWIGSELPCGSEPPCSPIEPMVWSVWDSRTSGTSPLKTRTWYVWPTCSVISLPQPEGAGQIGSHGVIPGQKSHCHCRA